MDIDALIAKYLAGACTPEESAYLNDWRKASPENELIFRRSEEAWHLARTKTSGFSRNKEKVWSGISDKISGKYSTKVLIRVASIAASVALLVGAGLSFILTGSFEKYPQVSYQQITLTVPGGSCSQVLLPDSTVVWLNASSIIRYPYSFSGDSRTIELIGEAFFEVTPDAEKPFIINSGTLQVKVLGTSFNFKHYPEDTQAVLAVETGRVALQATGTSKSTVLPAGKYATIEKNTLKAKIYSTKYNPFPVDEQINSSDIKEIENTETPAGYFSSWRDNKLVFRDDAFTNVLNELARRYNVIFEVSDEEIKDYIYTATFDNLMLEDVMELLKLSAPIDYTIENLTSNQMNAYGKRKILIFRK